MINFKYVRWKNFLSTGNVFTEIKLNKSQNTLIVGNNGAGKSTILDALCFGLYGKPFRKIKKEQLINSINSKDCVVEVAFSAYGKEFKIVRTIKPTTFEIYQNDVLINQSAASRDYQEILERNILKMNLASFRQIVILGSSSFVPFMQLKAAERREIIEELLDIRVFSTMSVLLKERIQTNNMEQGLAEAAVNSAKDMIRLQKENDERAARDTKKLVSEVRASIASVKKEIDKDQREKEKIEEEQKLIVAKIEELSSASAKYSKIKTICADMQRKIGTLQDNTAFYVEHDHCPTCSQGISEELRENKKSEISGKIAELEKALVDLNKKKTKTEEILAEINELNQKNTNCSNNSNNLYYRIRENKRIIDLHELRIKELSSTFSDNSTSKLQDLENTLAEKMQELSTLRDKRSILDSAALILKDTGIKARVIKQYVPVINALVNKYLASMDFFVKFELNENFEEKILSRHRDDFTYGSFSEGEKMRIDLALLFTWRTIARMKNSVATNLLILDEVFDASLDVVGCEEFLKMIHGAENANVFVISHKGDLLQDKFRSSIRFEKSNNFSMISK